ncbi:MAG: deoxyribose-phosphate aldolase [Culicoidibacterales bacterium]
MQMNKMIDHTLLRADALQTEVEKLCTEAKAYNFASVCVNPTWVEYAQQALLGSDVMVCTVVGFPLGATTTKAKSEETKQAIIDGADEIDMVINIGALKSGKNEYVENDIREVVEAANGKTVKVIIETCLLTDEEKILVCQLAKNAGAHFVKTSTGFSTGGATEADVKLMKDTVGANVEVKASGGVRSLEDAKVMIAAGATRIGTSNGVSIVEGTEAKNSY